MRRFELFREGWQYGEGVEFSNGQVAYRLQGREIIEVFDELMVNLPTPVRVVWLDDDLPKVQKQRS